MKISLNWLKEFVDIDINMQKSYLNRVVVGYVTEMEKHPHADRLNVAQVDIGNKIVQIICGGTNLKKGEYVPVALPGAVLPGNFAIKSAEIRGVESHGMICNAIELEMGTCDPKTIMLLKKAEIGMAFADYLKLKGYSPQELGELLTLKTAEVEDVIRMDANLDKVVTGKLLDYETIGEKRKHYHATVDIGDKKIKLVFGKVFNLEKGWILPIAVAGAVLPGNLKINESQVQGVLSQGMVCSDKELGVENTTSGLTIFPEGTKLGIPVAEALYLNDIQYEIDNKSLTHRPDLWGHYGIAREVAALTGKKLKPYKTNVTFPSKGEKLDIKFESKDLSDRFSACLISGIKIEESPQWLKGRLLAADVRPINNIVDVTNYVMLEYGQPLHSYDRDVVGTDTFLIRRGKKDETIETLDHKKRKVNQDDILVTDGKNFLDLAGIMGGLNSEINENTTNVILEAANWPASTIRKTSQKIGLRSDASQRYEKSLDPEMCPVAVSKAAELILQLCPEAKIISPLFDITNKKHAKLSSKLSINKTQKYLGKDLPAKDIQNILESLEFIVKPKGKDTFEVEIPSFRATKDVQIEEDLIEEVTRMHGYNNLEPLLPTLPVKVPEWNQERRFKHSLRDNLSLQHNFAEVYTYSFYGKRDIINSLLKEDNHILLENFLSEDQTHMRTSLIPNLLKAAELNTRHFDEFKLYEIGRSYINTGDYFPLEEKYLSGLCLYPKNSEESSFFALKGSLASMLKSKNFDFEINKNSESPAYAHPKQSAEININGTKIGHISTLHPIVQRNFGLEDQQVAIFEINLTTIFSLEKPEKRFKQINKFPSIEIDVSVLVDKDKSVKDIQDTINNSDFELIQNIELFDRYKGDGIPVDKIAMAFRITLQAENRTLTEEDMNQAQEKIFKALISAGGKIRGL